MVVGNLTQRGKHNPSTSPQSCLQTCWHASPAGSAPQPLLLQCALLATHCSPFTGIYWMNAITKPLVIGFFSYAASALGIWFVLSMLLAAFLPVAPNLAWLILLAIMLAPPFISGYLAAKYTLSKYRYRRIIFSFLSGMLGFSCFLLITAKDFNTMHWTVLAFILDSGVVAAAGGFTSTRPVKVPDAQGTD